MNNRPIAMLASVAALSLGVGIAGCGGSSSSDQSAANPNAAEVSPAGDIPDNQVFVDYSPPGSGYIIKVPEGWSRSSKGGAVTFTDKLNSIRLDSGTAKSAPTTADGNAVLSQLSKTVPGFKPGDVSTVKRGPGDALLITYSGDGPPDPVTGKAPVDAFERYEYFNNGKLAIVTLSGPQGADNVDPWMLVSDSLHWK